MFRHHDEGNRDEHQRDEANRDGAEPLQGIVMHTQLAPTDRTRSQVRVQVWSKDGTMAEFGEELSNLYQPAEGSPDAQQACSADAMRLCSDVIPDVPKVTACMSAKFSQLSEPCRVVMRGDGKHAVHHHHHTYRHCRHCR